MYHKLGAVFIILVLNINYNIRLVMYVEGYLYRIIGRSISTNCDAESQMCCLVIGRVVDMIPLMVMIHSGRLLRVETQQFEVAFVSLLQ